MAWGKKECEKQLPYIMAIAKGNKLLRTNGTLTKITEENKKDICPYFDSFIDSDGNEYATLKQDVFLVDALEIIRWNNTIVNFDSQYRFLPPDIDISEYKNISW